MKSQSNELSDTARLLRSLANSDSLNDLVDAGEKLFDNPIIITDNSWTVMAMSGDTDIPDDIGWNEFMEYGTLSLDTITLNIQSRLIERIESSLEPFIWEEPGMRYRRLLGNVTVLGKTAATVSVVEFHRTFRKNDPDRMLAFCDAVSVELQKSKYEHYSRGFMYEDFLIGIIEGKITSPKVISEKSKLFKLPIGAGTCVFIIGTSEKYRKKLASSTLMGKISNTLGSCPVIRYGERVLAFRTYNLVTSETIDGLDTETRRGKGRKGERRSKKSAAASADDASRTAKNPYGVRKMGVGSYGWLGGPYNSGRKKFDRETRALAKLLDLEDLYCGISRPAENLTQFPELLQQTYDALNVVMKLKSKQRLLEYDNAAVHLIAELCQEYANPSLLTHPCIKLLEQHDRNHTTQFTRSLQAWLNNARSVTDAAKEMHCHRNTLIYHLRRIEELTGLDLSDSYTLLYLEIAFRFTDN